MSIEESLKATILMRYKSVNDFASAIGVPQSTIASIFKRGIGKAGVQTVLKIFSALDLDVESIERGNLESKKATHGMCVSGELEALIKKYRSLDLTGQEAVQYTLNHEVQRMQSIRELEKRVKAESVPEADMYPYPYLRKIACAGTGFLFDDIPTDTVDVPYMYGADFIIGVNGDSMEPTYYDGDLLYVRKANHLDYGDIGIFIYAGECYVKEYGQNGLISHNENYPDIVGNGDIRVIGEVIGKVPE